MTYANLNNQDRKYNRYIDYDVRISCDTETSIDNLTFNDNSFGNTGFDIFVSVFSRKLPRKLKKSMKQITDDLSIIYTN